MTATQSHRRPSGHDRGGAALQLNKSDIVRALELDFTELKQKEDTPYPEPEVVVDKVIEFITLGLSGGHVVSIRNFGKFEPRLRSAVVRKNPKSGELISVPEKLSVGFVPAPALKNKLNK